MRSRYEKIKVFSPFSSEKPDLTVNKMALVFARIHGQRFAVLKEDEREKHTAIFLIEVNGVWHYQTTMAIFEAKKHELTKEKMFLVHEALAKKYVETVENFKNERKN